MEREKERGEIVYMNLDWNLQPEMLETRQKERDKREEWGTNEKSKHRFECELVKSTLLH